MDHIYREFLKIVRCPYDQAQLFQKAFKKQGPVITEGYLFCKKCQTKYPIIDSTAHLVCPSLIPNQILLDFEKKYHLRIKKNLSRYPLEIQQEINKQILHYDKDLDNFAKNPFWQIMNKIYISRSKKVFKKDDLLIDLCCGTGYLSLPLAKKENYIIGIDISTNVIKKANQDAKKIKLNDRALYIVADASFLPFTQESFNGGVVYGAIHHLPSPPKTFQEISRILKEKGKVIMSENNNTSLRFLFDLLMKIVPLWKEEAGKENLIERKRVQKWARPTQLVAKTSTEIFVPPHIFFIFKKAKKIGKALINVSNIIGQSLPWIKNQGGLISIIVSKK